MANLQENTGSFVQTTQIWDIGQLYEVDVNSEEFKELLVRLHQQINNIAVVLNTKKTAYYLQQTFNNSSQWYNPSSADPNMLRPGYTKVISVGALGAGVTNTAHGITIGAGSTIKFTYIGGAATDSVGLNFYPLPYAGGGAADIQVRVDATNVIITNNSGIVFTSAEIVLEYLEY
jgi:hypothetical protein